MAASISRIIVLGARGFFGGLAADRLRGEGLAPVRASRRPGLDVQLDANDAASIRSVLRRGDIVLDAAGPFQERSTALIEAALEIGFDVVDLSDSFVYAARVVTLRDRINQSGVRVLTACSAVSAVSAALIRASGIADPVRASVFLAPAAKRTANRGTTQSLLASLGRPVMVQRDGRLQEARGWRTSRTFAWPSRVAKSRGYLTEGADALLLPEIWPPLRQVEFWVDTQVPGVNGLLRALAYIPAGAAIARRLAPVGAALARRMGSAAGAFGVEIEAQDGSVVRWLLWAPVRSYLVAVAPAVLAVRALASQRFTHTGLISADRHVEPDQLLTDLQGSGIHVARSP